MRVLSLNTDAFGGSGGIALYNRDFLTALCNHPECQEVVALPRLMPDRSEPLPANLTWNTTGLGGKSTYIQALLRLLATDRRFDLIVCAHLNLLPMAWLAKSLIGAPLLVELYGIEAWRATHGWLVRQLVGKVDAYTAISTITTERFAAWSGVAAEKIHLMPNAIHLEWYGPGSKSPTLLARHGLEGRKVIMTLGRMSATERYKGFDEILEALPGLMTAIPEIAYLAVGDGDDRERLEKKAETLGVRDRVVFTGFVPEELKPDYYRLADLYVMPSYGEGFGFVFLEALACGVPCIGSREDGGREALRDGLLGELVSPSDQDSLRDAVLRGLKGAKGMIPEGLAHFAFKEFCHRVCRVVDNLTMQRGGLH